MVRTSIVDEVPVMFETIHVMEVRHDITRLTRRNTRTTCFGLCGDDSVEDSFLYVGMNICEKSTDRYSSMFLDDPKSYVVNLE